MVRIRKRSGREEEFDKEKLTDSLMATGAKKRHVDEVVNMVKETPGMSVNEIRSLVSAELGKRDKTAGERYDTTRRLNAQLSQNLVTGLAQLAEDDLAHLHVREGDTVDIVHGTRKVTLKATLAPEGVRGVLLGADDMRTLGLEESAKVAVRGRRGE